MCDFNSNLWIAGIVTKISFKCDIENKVCEKVKMKIVVKMHCWVW